MSGPLLHHFTLVSDWELAKVDGQHRVSGRGRTLAQEGFIHLCYLGQLAAVARRHWAQPTEPVCLLTVHAGLLDRPVVAENTSGGAELFPHLYGPLPVTAVINVQQLDTDEDGFLRLPGAASGGPR